MHRTSQFKYFITNVLLNVIAISFNIHPIYSTGVADKGLKSTGSADFNRVWSYMHTPAISLPLLQGENNLPLGVQLVGDRHDDNRFLGVANWLEKESKKFNE